MFKLARIVSDADTAAAASGTLTVMRSSSEPARASSRHWRVVDSTSAVSVLVMDCTTTGAWLVAARPLAALGNARAKKPNIILCMADDLGWAEAVLGFQALTTVFDGAVEDQIRKCVEQANSHVRQRRDHPSRLPTDRWTPFCGISVHGIPCSRHHVAIRRSRA